MSYGSCSFWFQGLDFVVDAGVRVADPSTVVDMTGSFPRIIRQGKVIVYSYSITQCLVQCFGLNLIYSSMLHELASFIEKEASHVKFKACILLAPLDKRNCIPCLDTHDITPYNKADKKQQYKKKLTVL